MLATPTEIQNFVETYTVGHISKAAIRLGITQPSLTQSLQKLEEKVGDKLFYRTKQGVVPTDAGKLFFAKANHLIDGWKEITQGVQNTKNELSGKFRLGCHVSVGSYTLAPLLKQLSENAPGIHIDLSHDFSRKIVEAVVSYQLDLGFVVNPMRHPDLVLKKIGEDRIRFWRKKGGDPIPQRLFADANIHQIEQLIGKTFTTRFKDWSLVESTSLELIRTLTLSGEGVGILPERIAKQEGSSLVPLDSTLPTHRDEIFLVYRKEAMTSRAGRELVRLAGSTLPG